MKPEIVKGLWMAPAWRTENSRSLWEVEVTSDEANAHVKMTLKPGWILVTPPNSGVFLDSAWDDKGMRYERFLLHAESILRIIPWTTDEDEMKTKGTRLLVRPDKVEEKKESMILVPEAFAQRPTTGVIFDVGDAVTDEDLVVGARILYSLYAGTDFQINGERLMLMEEKSAMMILEDDTEVTL